jgi:hypothetical protein
VAAVAVEAVDLARGDLETMLVERYGVKLD